MLIWGLFTEMLLAFWLIVYRPQQHWVSNTNMNTTQGLSHSSGLYLSIQ